MKSSSTPWIVLSVLVFFGYSSSYAALRLTHVLVHSSLWSSMEGLDGHHTHDVEGPPPLRTAYRPLISVETAVQRRLQP
jgi:hypothetical protein